MKTAQIIAISGLDGAGKTTQIDLIIQQLNQRNIPYKHINVRVGWTSGIGRIRNILFKKRTKSSTYKSKKTSRKTDGQIGAFTQNVYLWLTLLDLARVFLLLRWKRWQGYLVISNRGLWDNYVILRDRYPNIDLNTWWLWGLIRRCAKQPDLSIFITIPAELSYHRIFTNRGVQEEDLDTLIHREKMYREISGVANWWIVSAEQPPADLATIIWEKIYQRLI